MINRQKIVSYLLHMGEYVPENELKAVLWKTNVAYLKTRVVIEPLPRADRIGISGTRFELPLDLVSTTDYDHIILNLVENEFESMEDFKLINNTKRLCDYKYRIIQEDKQWFAVRLNYSWDALREMVNFLYFIHNDLEQFPGADEKFYQLVIANDKHLPDLRKTYNFKDIGIRIRFIRKHNGILYVRFDNEEIKDKFWEPMRRLNFLNPSY